MSYKTTLISTVSLGLLSFIIQTSQEPATDLNRLDILTTIWTELEDQQSLCFCSVEAGSNLVPMAMMSCAWWSRIMA